MTRGKIIGLLIGVALTVTVWLVTAVANYGEQYRWARDTGGFSVPGLVPLAADGFVAALAVLATVAACDARTAVPARTGTAVGILGSAAWSGAIAWDRTMHIDGYRPDGSTVRVPEYLAVVVAVAVPAVSAVALEAALAEIRRTVMRIRGLAAPVPLAHPRVLRWVLSPFGTAVAWRRYVLDATAGEVGGTQVPASVEVPSTQVPASVEVRSTQVPAGIEVTETRTRTVRVSTSEIEAARRAIEAGARTTEDLRIALGVGRGKACELARIVRNGG